MPFTPAHPAVLFPFRRFQMFKVSWTVLLIGSIVPDLEYFIWLSPSAYNSHTVEGIFLFNLPLTFILSFVWHHSLAGVVLPRLHFLRNELSIEKIPDFAGWLKKNWLVFLVSGLVGICSHLVWDSFCHANGYMAHRIPFLIDFTKLAGHDVRNCYIAWYISTVVGGLVMLHWYIDPKKIFSSSSWKIFFEGSAFWGKILFVAGLIAIARVAIGLSWNWTRHLVIITMGSLFYAFLIVCFWDKWIQQKQLKLNNRK